MKFWLGTDMPTWLDGRAGPVMVSRRRLVNKTFRPAQVDWVMDSGGFTELSLAGSWDAMPPHRYIAFVRRAYDQIGRMQWCAPQDWMCEPHMLALTGLSVREHQRRTVDNLIQLRTYAPDLPVIPVLQGWTRDDYLQCVDDYANRGVDLTREPVVGLGSVCRRQATDEIGLIVGDLHRLGLRLHGFGCKLEALRKYGVWLESADSMAWSFYGRRTRPCPRGRAASCAHCLHWAVEWRDKVTVGSAPLQDTLWRDGVVIEG